MLAWLKNNKQVAGGLLGIEIGPEGIALAHVQRNPGQPVQLRSCLFRPGTPEQHPELLKSLVAELGLAGMPVNFVLHPALYQMLLLDCPDVPADELRDALRWRIKELISEPLDQVVVDAFALPEDAYRGRSRMAYCAVLAKSHVATWTALLKHAGLRMQSIDITEMAFRNLGLQAGAEGLNLGLLRLRSSEGLICIQQGADLYMARRIEQGLDRVDEGFAGVTLPEFNT